MREDFQYKYKNYVFKERRNDEEIILVLRRHWLILLAKMLPLGLLFGGVVLFPLLVKATWLDLAGVGASNFDQGILNLLQVIFLMFLWLGLFFTWIDYYLDVWVVTNFRIINIEQHGLFRREVSELEHEKIQDVTTEIYGIIPTVFDFGNLFIQTAGEKTRFVFKQIPHPVAVRKIIMQLQKKAKLNEMKKEGEILRGKS